MINFASDNYTVVMLALGGTRKRVCVDSILFFSISFSVSLKLFENKKSWSLMYLQELSIPDQTTILNFHFTKIK